MLMIFHLPPPLATTAEHGFTLIELLVAMALSIIVLLALLAILEFSVGQETRISDRVQADRTGRLAMTTMVNELHSSCTGFGTTAIQAPASTPTSPLASSGSYDLWFLSAYGNASSGKALLTSVTEHDINWTKTSTSKAGSLPLGTLTDYSFASTGGSSPNWEFPALTVANAKKSVLATNLIPVQVAKVSQPIFHYFKFTTPESGTLVELKPEGVIIPTAATANEVVKVTIAFEQAANDGNTAKGYTPVAFNDSVVLRFNPAETGPEAEDQPCA